MRATKTRFLIGVLCLGIISLLFGIRKNSAGYDRIFVWDQDGYYSYLPMAFIHKSFDNPYLVSYSDKSPVKATGRIYTKYTCGVAMLQLPFFLLAEMTYAGEELTGKTEHHALWIMLAAVVYGTIGLWLLGMVLVRDFHIRYDIAFLTLCTLLLGSNLLWYTAGEPGMSHVYSFLLFSVIMYISPALITNPRWGLVLGFGFLVGLVTLVRPVNIIVLAYPLAVVLQKRPAWPMQARKLVSRLLMIAGVACLVWLPQFIYWHHVFGNWLTYSYTRESFAHWQSPHLSDVLFSHLNGWLMFSPVMALSLIGLLFIPATFRVYQVAILVSFLVVWYICASWWMWWFGGSFGYRSFIEWYTFLAIPLAFLLSRGMLFSGRWVRLAVTLLLLCGYWISLGFTDKVPSLHL